MGQKEIFLGSEADAWYQRNKDSIAQRDYALDPICNEILKVNSNLASVVAPMKILEVGCGEGRRLSWLAENISADVYGIEPSAMAVKEATRRNVTAVQGTADHLPFADNMFDILIFGYCLYLCDPEDLFEVAKEADRVLKSSAWLVIHDFHAKESTLRPYHHKEGVYSHKMDFRKLFDWHPFYECYSNRITHHVTGELCDDPDNWGSLSLLRKRMP